MKTVSFLDDVLYGVAHVLGIDPTADLLKDHARAWANSINSRVRYAWEVWDWPELTVTEERALRQVWFDDVVYVANQADNSELYYIPNDKYYTVIGSPPVGTLPTNATYFTEIAIDVLDRHIAYSQYGKQDIGQIYGVYNSSPRTNVPAIHWTVAPSGLGIDVPWFTGNTVWIIYKPNPPKFTSFTYDTATDYRRGDVVLDLDSGDCYVALASGTDKALTSAAYWLKQEFPYILSEYVKYAAAADQCDDLQTRDRLMEQAEDFLAREVDKCVEAGQIHKWSPGRTRTRLPLGTKGFLWSINPPLST